MASWKGNLDIVTFLISECNCNPQCPDNNGKTPLHCACEDGRLEVAKHLIKEHKCNPEHVDSVGYTPLQSAARNGHLTIMKYLISERGCNPQVGDSKYGFTPLHLAVFKGHHHIVKFLLSDCNCDAECASKYGITALQLACENGQLEVAKYLTKEHKCNPEHADNDGCTPLHSAARHGCLTIVKYLISELGCNPQIGNNGGLTPLHLAVFKGHHHIVKFLLSDCNCDAECASNNGSTPLHFACGNGHLEVAKYLVNEHKCDPKRGDVSGCTPLHSAARYGRLTVVIYLISELDCNPQICDNRCATPLHYATFNGHQGIIKFLMSDCNCNPQCCTNSGLTPLHCACENGQLEVAKYLVNDHKCNPEHADNGGNTPLHSAARNGCLTIVKYLISELNCIPQFGNNNGFTPLHFACEKGQFDVAKYLVSEHKCNPECGNMSGYTPLHSAASRGHLTIVKYLISELGCNPQIGDNNGLTPLHYASLKGHHEIVMYLANEHKCNPEHPNSTIGTTPLHLAARDDRLAVVQCLIRELGCNPQIADKRHNTPLHYACLAGSLNTVKFLTSEYNCDLGCIAQYVGTPLHCACAMGHLELVKYLVTQCKCDPMCIIDDRDTPLHLSTTVEDEVFTLQDIPKSVLSINSYKVFQSPLHEASLRGHLEVVRYLITECNCNPNSSDSFGFTPLGCALYGKHFETLRYLITECKCDTVCYPKVAGDFLQQYCGNWKIIQDFISVLRMMENEWTITLLPLASFLGDLGTVKVLCNCYPHVERWTLPCDYKQINIMWALLAGCSRGHEDIVRYLISQYSENDMLLPFLMTSCLHGHIDIVKFLIDECGCDPHTYDLNGLTSLHCTCSLTDFAKSHNLNSENSNVQDQGVLFHIWQALIYPFMLIMQLVSKFQGDVTLPGELNAFVTQGIDHDSRSLLELKSHKLEIFKYLVAEHKCRVQCQDKLGQTPLHYACASGQLNIVQYLHREKLSDLTHTTPSGNTPLHFACKFRQVEITQFLLSTGECKALCENAEGLTPLEMSTSTEIRELLENFCKGNYPLESIVKVFILGAPLAGKSSLVQALKSNHGFASSLIGRFQRVKGLKLQTAGIDSLSFCSSDFGNVVMFDFAGQSEFYTSHAAFLQNSSPGMAGIFILVVNIAECEDCISKNVQYWVSFIQECCAHSETKPRVIFVGSHADQLASGDVDQAFKLLKRFSQHSDDVGRFYTSEGIVCLDCTRRASHELDLLCFYLHGSFKSIRENTGSIDQRCYILHRYIRKAYTNAGVQGCTLENISKDLENNSYLLPSSPTELLPLFQTLHEKAQILLLENHKDIGDSWVITNIPALLETIVGSIFAPRDFPQHISPGSTGVVAKSRLCEAFPYLNTDMVIGFLEHFEFCHHLQSDWIKLSVFAETPKEVTDDDYYLFPALVTSNHLSRDSSESSHRCGWFIHSLTEYQFFTVRFLHVLLLQLAFNFALPQDIAVPGNTEVETPGLKRSCTMCKDGITWSDDNGVSTLLEVKDLKTVTLVMSSVKGREVHCVRLRTQLIKTILKAKNDFCPRALIEEFIMDIGSGRELQAVEDCPSSGTKYSIQYLSGRIAGRGTLDPPDMSLVNPDGSRGKQISQLLYFEPYSFLTSELITKLFSEEGADHIVPDTFISQLAGCLYPCNNILVQVLLSQPVLLREKLIDEMDRDALDCRAESSQLLRCVHILKAWVEQLGPDAKYRKLRQELNKFSIFCGRNPLDLVSQ